jgi:uncharacterized protein
MSRTRPVEVAALGRPAAYPRPTRGVEVIETHRSWVFLTDRHAYKLKKPVRFDGADLTTEDARRAACLGELDLNRRLAPAVYLRVVPLARDDAGRLRVEGPGRAVDWLIEMLRLPAERMLDARVRARTLTAGELDALVRRMVCFYRAASPVATSPAAVRGRIWRELRLSLEVLRQGEGDLDVASARRLVREIVAFLREHAALHARRIESGRIVEGHGDLRPEHVCLLAEPVVIDCLEFSRELRLIDPLQEMAQLALECRRLGADWAGERLLFGYRRLAGDDFPPELVGLYQAVHAVVRARLSFAHVLEPGAADPERWAEQTGAYLALGAEAIGASAAAPRVGLRAG